ncbi:TetR/AcrR family transcriptional regulator [Rubrolithibacter danxiaensis]|uniref:TetR/AcrR family transcriptional regulator n=1 Tax=Rubrolithibacter danxiaensis TaxID=3390805 RepID=UPI003BF8D956
MEERILSKAKELFFLYGIRSVTMEDIAKQMGVSKKTIYQFFRDKNEIVTKAITGLIYQHSDKIINSAAAAENAVHEVVLQTEALYDIFNAITPGIFYDVQKYFPEIWQLINGHKHDCILTGIFRNLDRGITEGLYRRDLNIKITAQMRLVQLSSAFNQQDFPAPEFEYRTVTAQLTELYLHAITSPKGQQLISNYLNTNYK